MAGAIGNHSAQDAASDQRQVANEIEDFVAHKLVVESQGRVLIPRFGQDDAVLGRSPADQTHVAHGLLVLARAESPCGRDGSDVVAIRKIGFEALIANQGMGEIDRVRDGIKVGWIHRNELFSLSDFDFTLNAKVLSRSALLSNTGFQDHVHERAGAAIENWEFEIVQFDDGIINSGANKSGEKVLGGGDQDAFLHQAGGVTDPGQVAPGGLDDEAVEVDAAEDNAATGSCRDNLQVNRSAAMEAYAFTLDSGSNCLFLNQAWGISLLA